MTQPTPQARQAELQALLARSAQGRTLYLDTETTGLSALDGDELLEIALVDDAGRILLDSLVRPVQCTGWFEAQVIHGIAQAVVAGAPSLDSLLPHLLEVIEGADTLVIYNADFDLSFLPAPVRSLAASKAVCAMQAFALHMDTLDRAPSVLPLVQAGGRCHVRRPQMEWQGSPRIGRCNGRAQCLALAER